MFFFVQNPDEQPEFPRISRKYFVQFMFLEEQVQPSNLTEKLDANSNIATDHQDLQSDQNVVFELGPATSDSLHKNTFPAEPLSDSRSPLRDSGSPIPDSRSPIPDRSSIPDRSPIPDSRSPILDSRSPLPDSNSPLQKTLMKLEKQPPSALIPIVTTTSDWMEDMVLNWTNVVTRSNLLELRNFTQAGMIISVMEEKVSPKNI